MPKSAPAAGLKPPFDTVTSRVTGLCCGRPGMVVAGRSRGLPVGTGPGLGSHPGLAVQRSCRQDMEGAAGPGHRGAGLHTVVGIGPEAAPVGSREAGWGSHGVLVDRQQSGWPVYLLRSNAKDLSGNCDRLDYQQDRSHTRYNGRQPHLPRDDKRSKSDCLEVRGEEPNGSWQNAQARANACLWLQRQQTIELISPGSRPVSAKQHFLHQNGRPAQSTYGE
jgi:hypothetical protein